MRFTLSAPWIPLSIKLAKSKNLSHANKCTALDNMAYTNCQLWYRRLCAYTSPAQLRNNMLHTQLTHIYAHCRLPMSWSCANASILQLNRKNIGASNCVSVFPACPWKFPNSYDHVFNAISSTSFVTLCIESVLMPHAFSTHRSPCAIRGVEDLFLAGYVWHVGACRLMDEAPNLVRVASPPCEERMFGIMHLPSGPTLSAMRL